MKRPYNEVSNELNQVCGILTHDFNTGEKLLSLSSQLGAGHLVLNKKKPSEQAPDGLKADWLAHTTRCDVTVDRQVEGGFSFFLTRVGWWLLK